MLGFYVVTKAMGILRQRCDGCGFSQQSWVSAVKRDGALFHYVTQVVHNVHGQLEELEQPW